MVSTTTFAAPGFNQDVLDKHGKIIAELTLEGKITEYQNYLDPVGSLLNNVTQPIYIESTAPSAPAFHNHSSFLNVINEDGQTFKQCDVQEKSIKCNVVRGATVLFDKVPNDLKGTAVELILSTWQGIIEPEISGKAIISGSLLALGATKTLLMPVETLASIVGSSLIVAAVGELTQLIEVGVESVKNFIELQTEKITETLKQLVEEEPAIGALYNLLIGEFDKAWDDFKKCFSSNRYEGVDSIKNADKYTRKMERVSTITTSSRGTATGTMEVDINKLKELYNSLNKLYAEHRGAVRTIYTVTQNRAKMTQNRYSQYYVDSAASKVTRTSAELESAYNDLNKQFATLTSALQSARKGYISEEKELSRMVRI